MPFPSTSTVHPNWSRHHQPAAAAALSGALTIRIPSRDTEGWDPEHGPTPGAEAATPLWTGPFRAQAHRSDTSTQAAGQSVTVRTYLITLPADTPDIPIGARATVNEAPDDPHLVGKTFTVTGVTYGSHRFQRDLYADLDLTNQPGGS